jgi:hypothetical protein
MPQFGSMPCPNFLLARYLGKKGDEITYVSCGGVFSSICNCMYAHGLTERTPKSDRLAVCDLCKVNARILSSNSFISQITLDAFVSEADLAKANDLVSNLSKENYLDFEMAGVQVGRLATYEVLLRFKKLTSDLTEEEWVAYKAHLRGCILSLLATQKIVEKEKPEVMVAYSPQYGVIGVAAAFLQLRGTKVYFLEGSSSNAERYQSLRVWDWSVFGLLNPALSYWPTATAYLRPSDIARVNGHFAELLRGRSFAVYSEPISHEFDIRNFFDIPQGTKIALAALSSSDEAYAAYIIGGFKESKVASKVFTNQFEWIKFTISALASRPELYFIIRLHPRDAPNKRESVTSEQFRHWQELLHELPANIRVNWPQDKVSIYDLLPQVDLLVTGWSVTALEAMVQGIPVVTYDQNLPSYPSDIHFTGSTRSEYLHNIDLAIQEGRNQRHILNAYKWLAMNFGLGTARTTPWIFSDGIGNSCFLKTLRRLARIGGYRVSRYLELLIAVLQPKGELKRIHELFLSRKNSLFALPHA